MRFFVGEVVETRDHDESFIETGAIDVSLPILALWFFLTPLVCGVCEYIHFFLSCDKLQTKAFNFRWNST